MIMNMISASAAGSIEAGQCVDSEGEIDRFSLSAVASSWNPTPFADPYSYKTSFIFHCQINILEIYII